MLRSILDRAQGKTRTGRVGCLKAISIE